MMNTDYSENFRPSGTGLQSETHAGGGRVYAGRQHGPGAAPTGTSVGAHRRLSSGTMMLNEFNGLSVHKAVNEWKRSLLPHCLEWMQPISGQLTSVCWSWTERRTKSDWAATPFIASPLPACALRLLPTRCRCTAISGAER